MKRKRNKIIKEKQKEKNDFLENQNQNKQQQNNNDINHKNEKKEEIQIKEQENIMENEIIKNSKRKKIKQEEIKKDDQERPTKKRKQYQIQKLINLKRKLRKVNWRDLDFIGMEVKGIPEILSEPFEFPDLNYQLRDGELSKISYPLYMFMGGQPIQLGENIVKNIPYIVVIVCKKPPSGKLAMTSVQSSQEIIQPMEKFHMTWAPYIPKKLRSNVELPIQIFTLAYEGRKVTIEKLSAERKHQISLLMPYELLPQKFNEKTLDERLKEVRSVNFEYTAENGKKFGIVWDKDCHRLAFDIDVIIEDEGLSSDEKPRIEAKLKEEFQKARELVKKRYEQDKLELDKLSEEEKKSLEEIKIYKFYPTHPDIPIKQFIDPTINRYYGKAYKVFPQQDIPHTNNSKNSSGFIFKDPLQSNNTNVNNNSTGFIFLQPLSNQTETTTTSTNNFIFGQNSTNISNNESSSGGFIFGKTTSATTAHSSNYWKCPCCEGQNPENEKYCLTCCVSKPSSSSSS